MRSDLHVPNLLAAVWSMQYFFNLCLQLKDEMTQVAEQLQPRGGAGSM